MNRMNGTVCFFSKLIGSFSKGSVFHDLQVATDVGKTSCILICFPGSFWQVTSDQNLGYLFCCSVDIFSYSVPTGNFGFWQIHGG